MRYAAMLLIALSGACDPLKGFNSFGGPRLVWNTVTVSPTVIRAGSQFIASASVTYSNCETPVIVVNYAGQTGSQQATAFGMFLTAVLGQTTVTFEAVCVPGGGGSAIRDSRSVTIEVTPAL